MNITVIRTDYSHTSESKFYEIVQILDHHTVTGIVIRRWGKVGASGQVKVKRFGKLLDAKDDAAKEHNNRLKRGYYKRHDAAASALDSLGAEPQEDAVAGAIRAHYGANAGSVLAEMGLIGFGAGDSIAVSQPHVGNHDDWGTW